jgi:K+-sensing histidine kinase KdpD
MPKPTYEALQRRVKELEKITGELIDKSMDAEQMELFELSILHNVSQALVSTRDLDELLSIIIDAVNKSLLTEGAGVLLYDENRGDLYWREVRDARRILAPQSERIRMPLDGSIAGWVFKNNKPARVNDTSKDARYYAEITKKTNFAIKKVLQVPLNTREKTIGVLMAMNKIGGDFTESDEALLGAMANNIALALENATVYENLKKSRDDLEMIYRSSMALATTMDLDHLLEVVIGELRSRMDAEAAGVLLYDERQGDLYWREVQDDKGLLNPKIADIRLPLDGSISGHVFQTGEPTLLNDPENDPNFFAPFVSRTGFHIRNEIMIPLHTREKTIGVLVTINKKEGQFSEDDLQLLSSLAGVVAMAVENSTFFEEMLDAFRELEDLNLVKSKILNHLSHELRTPLAIIRGSLVNMKKRLNDMGIPDFERALERMERHVQSLNRLETQVESIMMTGYAWERRQIAAFLQAAMDLMEVQTEYTPEIQRAASIIGTWLEKTFPTRRDELERIKVKDFGEKVFELIKSKAEEEGRKVRIDFQINNTAELLIPGHVLQAVMEGLIRNAIEATPDHGLVKVTGGMEGDRYVLTVKDTGIGIPEKDQERVFQGFYPVQDTESYASKRPYSFNAGGKGIDLLRIRMFSELYDFKLSFTSARCPHISDAGDSWSGEADFCEECKELRECPYGGGSEFVVDFPLAHVSSLAASGRPPKERLQAVS